MAFLKYSFLLLTISSFAPDSFALEKWTYCQSTNDCVKVRAQCDAISAINKTFIHAHQKRVRESEILIQCAAKTKEEIKHNKTQIAVCTNGRCNLVTPKN